MVREKFLGKKQQIIQQREQLCPDRNWRFMLVYGNLKYPEELDSIKACGVEVKYIGEVLEELQDRKHHIQFAEKLTSAVAW